MAKRSHFEPDITVDDAGHIEIDFSGCYRNTFDVDTGEEFSQHEGGAPHMALLDSLVSGVGRTMQGRLRALADYIEARDHSVKPPRYTREEIVGKFAKGGTGGIPADARAEHQ